MDILCTIRLATLQQCIALKSMTKTYNVNEKRAKGSTALDLAYKIHGHSPLPSSVPIFVLHGLLGSKKNWESMCTNLNLSTNRPVIAVDARNHGDSPHTYSHSYIDLAADVSKLITKFELNKCIVIGHSMGGRTAMVLALSEPSKIASLIVVDISPVSSTRSDNDFFPKLFAAMNSVDFAGAESLSKAKTAAKLTLAKSGLFQHEEEIYFIVMNVGQLPDKSFGWKCNVDALEKNFRQIASFPDMGRRVFRGHTLFIGGKKSYYIPPDDLQGIRKLFPNAHLHYVEGVGHNVHAENPAAFLTTVTNFFSYTAMNQSLV